MKVKVFTATNGTQLETVINDFLESYKAANGWVIVDIKYSTVYERSFWDGEKEQEGTIIYSALILYK